MVLQQKAGAGPSPALLGHFVPSCFPFHRKGHSQLAFPSPRLVPISQGSAFLNVCEGLRLGVLVC